MDQFIDINLFMDSLKSDRSQNSLFVVEIETATVSVDCETLTLHVACLMNTNAFLYESHFQGLPCSFNNSWFAVSFHFIFAFI